MANRISCIICEQTLENERLESASLPICDKCLDIGLKVIRAYSKLADSIIDVSTHVDSQEV